MLIPALDRKLLRDLWHIKGQAIAIILVIACGVAAYVMTLSALSSLKLTRATYYDRHYFAEVFTRLKRAPRSLADRIVEIPGVARVSTRVVMDVTLDVPGLAEPAIGRLISLPDREDGADLNQIYLRMGRLPNPERDDEVMCGEAFALAHKFKPGDKFSAIINGRKKPLRIVGIALSPEYIFQMRAGDFFPDDRRFGIFWMARRTLEYAFDMRGSFNDISLTLAPSASEPEVIRRLDRLTEHYGGLGAFGRNHQLSHKFISDEFEQLKNISRIAPTIFLGVASFLLNVVLTRIVNAQREQIAALKAFGYSNWAVGWHYLKLTLVIVALGLLVGFAGGIFQGHWLTTLYTRFYRFPMLHFMYDPQVFLGAAGLTTLAAVVGTGLAVRRAIILPPAEAMRPPAPANYRPTIVERLGMSALLSPTTRMILRHVERKPISASLGVVGIAFAAAILIMGFYIGDAFDRIVDVQFNAISREHVTVAFVEPRSAKALHELADLPGVETVEPYRAVAVRLRHGHLDHRLGLMGLIPGPDLHRLVDDQLRPVQLPPDGLVLGQKLAEILGVKAGEYVTVEVMEGKRPTLEVPVTALVKEFVGAGAFMDKSALNRLLQEGDTISGGYLQADKNSVDGLFQTLKRRPGVAGVSVREAMMKNFQDIQAENMRIIRSFYIVFGVIIAFGVVYNAAQVTLAERSRELASLRVLGFTRVEISIILLGELAVLILLAIPVGMLLGVGLAALISRSVNTEQIRLPLVIAPLTFSVSAIVVLTAGFVSALLVRRKLDHLDLVAVLKTQY